MQYQPLPRADRLKADYSQWSIEELWQLVNWKDVAERFAKVRKTDIGL